MHVHVTCKRQEKKIDFKCKIDFISKLHVQE